MKRSLKHINKYKNEGDFTSDRYFCIDQNNNYYIFDQKSIMNFELILDSYTIDLPEFIEVYYVAEAPEKVALNIQKTFDALNCKDYNYVYSKLSEGFKKNYFNGNITLKVEPFPS